jgi:NAD(P)-dependent dehydrogenase (short-subunit alcohol dehydrogenase family)
MSRARFANKGALVTGGASGLGAAIAAALAHEGARVIVADRDAAGAARVASAIVADGGQAQAITGDVAIARDVTGMVDAATAAGGLHVLVLSAAIEVQAPLAATTDAAWQTVLDVNLKGPFLCMRAAIPAIARAGGGAVEQSDSPGSRPIVPRRGRS